MNHFCAPIVFAAILNPAMTSILLIGSLSINKSLKVEGKP